MRRPFADFATDSRPSKPSDIYRSTTYTADMMQEPTFAILTSLADGPRHGYAIMADVAELTERAVRLQAGTLYGALERLRVDGRVEISGEEVVNGRLRRSYALTASGAEMLRTEAERRRIVADKALRRLSTSPVLGAAG